MKRYIALVAGVAMLGACNTSSAPDSTDDSDTTTTVTKPVDDEAAPTTTAGATTPTANAAAPEVTTPGATSNDTPDKPEVSLPDSLPTELVATVLTEGTGPQAGPGDTVTVHYVGVRSEDGTEFDNSYNRGTPFPVQLGMSAVIKGWEQGLVGAQAGSRIQLDIPAELAYGDQERGAIKPGDALSFVIDVIKVDVDTHKVPEPVDLPDYTVPGANPTKVTITDLAPGDGDPAKDGDLVGFLYAIVNSTDGTIVYNSFEIGQEAVVHVGAPTPVPGLQGAFVDARTGMIRQVDIPAEQATGEFPASGAIPDDAGVTFIFKFTTVETPPPVTTIAPVPKPDVVLPTDTPTELGVTTLIEGDGQGADNGDTVVVHYVGVRSEDGTEFDNSYDRGTPFPVKLGTGAVIKGWDQGLIGAKKGSRIQLDIPAELAYGDQDLGVVKPGDALTFVIDIVDITPGD